MTPIMTTNVEIVPVLISLVPVVVGGLLTFVGGIGGGILMHTLKNRDAKVARRAEKYEELLEVIYNHKHWLNLINGHRVYGYEAPAEISPITKVRAIASLYFPSFKDKVAVLDLAADQYELWMFKAGQERLKQGIPSAECMAEAKLKYQPYLQALHELINALEDYALTLHR